MSYINLDCVNNTVMYDASENQHYLLAEDRILIHVADSCDVQFCTDLRDIGTREHLNEVLYCLTKAWESSRGYEESE